MSTRANIIIKDEYEELIFYRHSDGYPEGTMPTLKKFLNLVKSGKIRDDASQAAGWLIIIGHEEYLKDFRGETKPFGTKLFNSENDRLSDWKVGAYEPTSQIHGDIEYLYTVDLEKKEITYKKV